MRAAERMLLLLCCRLGQQTSPLHPAEYRFLAERLQNRAAGAENPELTERVLRDLGLPQPLCERILSLLNREERLDQYLSAAPDVTVVTRLSEYFPKRLRRLRDCPPALFCKGDPALLRTQGVSLVGSRALLPRGRAFAERVGLIAAQEGFTLISGGAAGADRAAQEACLAADGRVVSFVPDDLQRYAARPGLLLCCDEGYELPFSAARALRRNTLIHALGEKTLVAQCTACKGGTWSGAIENLRHGLSELYVLRDGAEGSEALLARGATPVDDFLTSLRTLTPDQLSFL